MMDQTPELRAIIKAFSKRGAAKSTPGAGAAAAHTRDLSQEQERVRTTTRSAKTLQDDIHNLHQYLVQNAR